RDPKARPTGDDVLRRLGLVPSRRPEPRADRMALVGREPLLARLLAAFERARAGEARSVGVRGPSGLGKSALVQRFLAAAALRGARVLLGRCFEQESVPYKAFDNLVDELSDELASFPAADVTALLPDGASELVRLFPVLRRVSVIGAATRSAVRLSAADEA